jgi:hypothetical protein
MLAKIAIISSQVRKFQNQTEETVYEIEMKPQWLKQILTKNASNITTLQAPVKRLDIAKQ